MYIRSFGTVWIVLVFIASAHFQNSTRPVEICMQNKKIKVCRERVKNKSFYVVEYWDCTLESNADFAMTHRLRTMYPNTHKDTHWHWGTINMELGYAKVPELFSTLFLWFTIHIFGSAHNRFALSVQWASLGFRESNFQVTRLLFSSCCSCCYNVYTVIKSRHGHLQLLTNTAAVWNWDSHNTKQHNTRGPGTPETTTTQHDKSKSKSKTKLHFAQEQQQ